jgi:hypothetical protein
VHSIFLLLQLASHDTLQIRNVAVPPIITSSPDTVRLGPAQLHVRTRQGTALVWLLRAADTFFVAAAIRDTSRHWADDFVMSLDTRGDGGESPGHDDFQWDFRRAVDSSVVFRGRNGRWEPPKADPDWRLKSDRSGGGWEVGSWDGPLGWGLVLRLDPAWLEGADGKVPRIAFRVFDNDPQGWFAWPSVEGIPQASSVEQTPRLWVPVR